MSVEIQEASTVMPFVRFETLAVEDKAASLAAGHYVARDVDVALITPPYSKDVFKQKVGAWFDQLRADVKNRRIPDDWVDKYIRMYEAFKKGQELPIDGTPIKSWGVISPAQQKTLIAMHILTVEDLAKVNDEGLKRIGMGAADLKNKANAWLRQLKKAGSVAIEFAAIKNENEQLIVTVAALEKKVEELSNLLKSASFDKAVASGIDVDINDLIGDVNDTT